MLDRVREAKLWYLLGELESERAVEYYERSWEVSWHTTGRAMPLLGGYSLEASLTWLSIA